MSFIRTIFAPQARIRRYRLNFQTDDTRKVLSEIIDKSWRPIDTEKIVNPFEGLDLNYFGGINEDVFFAELKAEHPVLDFFYHTKIHGRVEAFYEETIVEIRSSLSPKDEGFSYYFTLLALLIVAIITAFNALSFGTYLSIGGLVLFNVFWRLKLGLGHYFFVETFRERLTHYSIELVPTPR